MKKTRMIVLLLWICCVFCGCGCKHEWQEANCRYPKTCLQCGETEGEPLGHVWQEATCSAGRTCSRCGKTRGNPLPHTFAEPTCTKSATCVVCGTTDGDPLGHQAGDWEILSEDRVKAIREQRTVCRVCGEELQRETVTLEVLHDGAVFILTPREFSLRLQSLLDTYKGNAISVLEDDSTEKCMYVFQKEGEEYGNVRFLKGRQSISGDQKDAICFSNILCSVSGDNNIVRVMTAIIQTCDPVIGFEEAKAIASSLLESGDQTVNGITYSYNILGAVAFMSAALAD